MVGSAKAAPPKGHRQRSRTRMALLSAGQQLFAQRHIDSISIDDIVDTADVGKGSFYNHFDGKTAFAQAVYELVQGDIEFHIYSVNQDVADPAMRIARALCTVLRYAREHPDRLQSLISLSTRGTDRAARLNSGMVSDIRHGLDQHRLSGIDVGHAVLVVIGMTNMAVSHLTSETDANPTELATGMAAAMLRALGMNAEDSADVSRAAAAELLGGGEDFYTTS